MQLTARHLSQPFTIRRSRSERRGGHAPSPAVPVATETQLAARAGGPEDRALYTCGCGFAWKGAVTATVGCPHCGTAQAW